MGKKKIKMNLSVSSVENAIKQIEEYKRSLVLKTAQLLEELGKIGIRTINQRMSSIQGDSNPNHYAFVKMNSYGSYTRATIILQGRDILFIEFGSGIHYNGAVGSSPHPKGQQMGYTIGSYGKGQGANDSWVYFNEEHGRFETSQGTKAAMPMYNAEVEIRKAIKSVAKKVFGG